jgi:hypothetical protein
VADRLLDVVPADGPVIVDLSRLVVAPDELAWLILRFEAAPHWHRFRLVDDRIDHRRQLRQLCRRVPVLPDVATALAGARTEVPAGTPCSTSSTCGVARNRRRPRHRPPRRPHVAPSARRPPRRLPGHRGIEPGPPVGPVPRPRE